MTVGLLMTERVNEAIAVLDGKMAICFKPRKNTDGSLMTRVLVDDCTADQIGTGFAFDTVARAV